MLLNPANVSDNVPTKLLSFTYIHTNEGILPKVLGSSHPKLLAPIFKFCKAVIPSIADDRVPVRLL